MIRVRNTVVIGSYVQALGLARDAKSCGQRVIILAPHGFSLASYSNCVDMTIRFINPFEIVNILNSLSNDTYFVIPSDDEYISILSKNRKVLNPNLILGIPDETSINLFNNKELAYEYAEKHNIAHPESLVFSDYKSLSNNFDKLNFPVVVKPQIMYSFSAEFGVKAFLCNTVDELSEVCKKISEKYPINKLIFQEFIQGGSINLYSYGVFAIDGQPKAWIIANRIRQRPAIFGKSTTCAISCDIQEIKIISDKLLADTKYSGLAEIEYMFDSTTGKYKFLEINTRAWKWHTISMGRGFGFLSEWINFLNGIPGKFVDGNKTSVKWKEHISDWYMLIINKTYRKVHSGHSDMSVSAVFDMHDILPSISLFFHIISRGGRNLFKKHNLIEYS